MSSVIFFGSFQDHSVKVLEALLKIEGWRVAAVVTTPAGPTGKKGQLEPGPVARFAQNQGLKVLTPAKLDKNSLAELPEADYFVTAGYGKLLPASWLSAPKIVALNIHFSLLPKYRGANPAEWALLSGETQTGISVIEMAEKFDTGGIIATANLDISPTDTRQSLYRRLYELAARTAGPILEADFELRTQGTSRSTQEALNDLGIDFYHPAKEQGQSPTPFARRLGREDGYISSRVVKMVMAADSASSAKPRAEDFSEFLWQRWQIWQKDQNQNLAAFAETAVRALQEFPGVYSEVETTKGRKRLKIHSAEIKGEKLTLSSVQLEGQTRASFNQIKNSLKLG